MRHTPLFRLMAALFGVWFTFTLVQANGLSGMSMSGSGASMNMIMPAGAMMAGMPMADMPTASMDRSAGQLTGNANEQLAAQSQTNQSTEQVAEQGAPDKSKAPTECDQHDCCCSALSPISLMPVAAFSWLPEHVVNQDPPRSGNGVVYTEGQLLLPFANGPPRTVTA